MPLKLSRKLKRAKPGESGVDAGVHEYEQRFETHRRDGLGNEEDNHLKVNNLYYDLATDFYEYGWGRSFHFAPRAPGESFKESIARHERGLATALDLKPGMVVADIGSGVAGPLIEIARFSGATIVGINSNEYQIERARTRVDEAGLSPLADFIHCDFLNVDAPDESFDAAYSIEATCLAPDKVSVYGEIFRLLKPGASFAAYEYAMTDRFDAENPVHLRLKADIQLGGGLLVIDNQPTVDGALRSVGFDVVETRDLALQTEASIPWYQPLAGSRFSVAGFRSSRAGRWATVTTLRALEGVRIAPKGSVRVAQMLNLCGAAIAEAGRLGIFTPMYFIHGRKPG